MFRQDDFYIIKDGVKALAISDDNQVFWTEDLRLAHRFTNLREADTYCYHYIKTQKLREEIPIVKRMIVQYIVP